jgi:hypothetical protein
VGNINARRKTCIRKLRQEEISGWGKLWNLTRSSFQGVHWYSDFAVLTYPTAAAKKPAATDHSGAIGSAGSNIGRRNDGEPLSLIPHNVETSSEKLAAPFKLRGGKWYAGN